MTAEPSLYDFRRPSRLSREHVRALQIVNETFARQFALVLSTTLHASCQVKVSSVHQVTSEEYIRGIPTPSLLAVLSFDPLPGAGVFQAPMGIVMSVVDRLLGGLGGADQPSRALSEIEIALVRRLLQRIVRELPYAFDSLTPVHPEVSGLESDPQFLQIAAPSEPVIVSDFAIRVGDLQATSTLCLPFATLQPALDALSEGQPPYRADADLSTTKAVEQHLYAVPVEVSVAFREVTLTSRDLLALSVGDVLPLRHPVTAPLAVLVDGVQVAAAVPGSHGPRLACQVVTL